MRVLHVITGLGKGGAETMLFRLVEETRKRGCESIVFALGKRQANPPPFERIGVDAKYLDMDSLPTAVRGLFRLVRAIKEEKPDLVQGWMYHANVFATIARALARSPAALYWNIRQSLYSLRNEKPQTAAVILVSRFLSWIPDKILYNSQTSSVHHQRLGYPVRNSVLIPNGFDTKLFRPPRLEERKEARARLGLPPDAVVFSLIARFHPVKDHKTFFTAASFVSKTHPTAHFLLAGRALGPVKQWVATAGLETRFTFLEEREDIHQWLGSLDVAVSSSIAEAFPNVVGEAMSAGLPCIVTDVGDSARVLGNAGIVVRARDPEGMAEAMAKLVELGETYRTRLGAIGRNRIADLYSIEAVGYRFMLEYKSATQAGGALCVA